MKIEEAITKARQKAMEAPYANGFGVFLDNEYGTYRVADNNDILDAVECMNLDERNIVVMFDGDGREYDTTQNRYF